MKHLQQIIVYDTTDPEGEVLHRCDTIEQASDWIHAQNLHGNPEREFTIDGSPEAWCEQTGECGECPHELPTFTVLGYYEDNRQPWATSVQAEDAETAEGLAKQEMADTNEWDDTDNVITVGVVEGKHSVTGGDEGSY